MALVGINPVGRAREPVRQRERTNTEKILEALQIANQAFQIPINVQRIQKHSAEIDQIEADRKLTEAETADLPAQRERDQEAHKLDIEQKKASIAFKKADTDAKKSVSLLNAAKTDNEKRLAINPSFKNLPENIKSEVKTLSNKNAGVTAITSQISSALTQLKDPAVSKEDKLRVGQMLIKTLNSTEGSDAVGKEEAARLAGELQSNIVKLIPDPQKVGIGAGAGAGVGAAFGGIGAGPGALIGGGIAAGVDIVHGLVDAMDDPGGLRLTPNIEGFTKRVELTLQKLNMAIVRNELISNGRQQGLSLTDATKQADETIRKELEASRQQNIPPNNQPIAAPPPIQSPPIPSPPQLPRQPAPSPFQNSGGLDVGRIPNQGNSGGLGSFAGVPKKKVITKQGLGSLGR